MTLPRLERGSRVRWPGGEGRIVTIHPFPCADRVVEVLDSDGNRLRLAPRELTLILPGDREP
jgi:hypothetical protein